MTTLTLQQANAIIAGALAQSAKSGYLPMGVVVDKVADQPSRDVVDAIASTPVGPGDRRGDRRL